MDCESRMIKCKNRICISRFIFDEFVQILATHALFIDDRVCTTYATFSSWGAVSSWNRSSC